MDVLPRAKRKLVLHALAPLAYAKVKYILLMDRYIILDCGKSSRIGENVF